MEDVAKYKQLANDVFIYGNVSLVLAMAKETNLIHGLCTAQQPLSSSALASQLKLKERYVREILNSLTVAGLVQLEAGTGGKDGKEARYWVSHSCRQVLLTMSTWTLAVSVSARQFTAVRQCLDEDGPYGVPYDYSSYEELDEFSLEVLDSMCEGILQTPGLKEQFEKGLKALEVGCGTGRLSLRLASMFPKSHFILSDIRTTAIDSARQLAEKEDLTNVSFRILDVCRLPDEFKNSFDWVGAADIIHGLPHPSEALHAICEVLKPGGHHSLVDEFVSSYLVENIKCKDSAALYAMSTFMCLPESYQHPDSEALGPCWGTEKATELIKEAGMNVLGLTRSEALCTMAVCMCQKPK